MANPQRLTRREVEKICRIHAINQRRTHGDAYATESELAQILEDPLAFDRMFTELFDFIGVNDNPTYWKLTSR